MGKSIIRLAVVLIPVSFISYWVEINTGICVGIVAVIFFWRILTLEY